LLSRDTQIELHHCPLDVVDIVGFSFCSSQHASLEATYIYDAVTIFASAVSRLATADLVRDAANGSLLFDTILAQPNYTCNPIRF